MNKEKSILSTYCTKFAGGIYLTLVICIWVFSGLIIQTIFSSDDTKFSKPLFLTYFSTSFFLLHFILPIVRFVYNKIKCRYADDSLNKLHESEVEVNKSNRYSSESQQNRMKSVGNDRYLGSNDELLHEDENSDNLSYIEAIMEETAISKKLSTKETFYISLYYGMFWFIANYFYNSGLKYTLLSSSTIISNTSILFVYIFSFILIKDEKFNIYILLGVFVAFGGVTLITITESEDSSSHAESRLLGDIFTIISAIAYGIYSTFLKIKIPEEVEKEFNMSLFFGFVGLANIVVLSPLLVIFHFTGLEPFEFPNTKTLMFLSINAIIGTCISDYCWAKSVILLGPLFTQLGICLTIPIGIIVTSFINKINFSFLYFLGTALVLIAFVTVTTVQYFENKKKRIEKIKKFIKYYNEQIRSSKLMSKNIDQNGSNRTDLNRKLKKE